MFSFLRLIILLGLYLFSAVTIAAETCKSNDIFNIGAGIYDITGPAAEQGMMGYGMLKQKTGGISQRLWARAFVIESPCNGKRIVFVNADLGHIFQGIKQQVVLKLKEKYGNRYDDSNILLTATHTHSGPGGYSTYAFYNLTTLGFSRDNFNTIVNGIVAAIDRAQNNLKPGKIKLAKGDLSGINFNRSPTAYQLNPAPERNLYKSDTDTEMTLIRFDSLDGHPIGTINWFPIHGVSMNNKNDLISGDNKGYAEYLFEKDFKSDYGPSAFVAAFAQANAGDVSPNPLGQEGGSGLAGLQAIEKAGLPQYQKAKQLFNEANEIVKGEIDYRHTYVAMDKVTVDPQYANGNPRVTCPAAIGVSMLAGTQDGEGVGKQGVTCETVSSWLPHFICEMSSTNCQGVKPIALETGTKKPYPWTPNVLPFQIVKIGNLIIAAAPFELTTMTGRRIKETVANQFSAMQGNHVVLSALSNAYAGYVATNEEYQLQRYEGASTHFGPWTQAALQQEFAKLGYSLSKGLSVAPGPTPLDLSGFQINLQTGVVFDDKPVWKSFGDIYQETKAKYKPGDTVEVIFWGAHPKNNYRVQDTFLAVEKLTNGTWETVATDRDWETSYHWERSGVSYSLVTITWRIPKDASKGQYRIVHFGDWKSGWTWKIAPYSGYSGVFSVRSYNSQ